MSMFNELLLKSQGILLTTGCIYWGAVIDNEHWIGIALGHQNMCTLLISVKEVYVSAHYIVSCESCFAGLANGIFLS